jgi:hypothetical protein
MTRLGCSALENGYLSSDSSERNLLLTVRCVVGEGQHVSHQCGARAREDAGSYVHEYHGRRPAFLSSRARMPSRGTSAKRCARSACSMPADKLAFQPHLQFYTPPTDSSVGFGISRATHLRAFVGKWVALEKRIAARRSLDSAASLGMTKGGAGASTQWWRAKVRDPSAAQACVRMTRLGSGALFEALSVKVSTSVTGVVLATASSPLRRMQERIH